MPLPYLLQVHSHPKQLSQESWKKWYQGEHLKDMVEFHAANTGALYQSTSPILRSSNSPPQDGSETMEFLALYQTDRPITTDSEEVKKVRQASGLWEGDVGDGLSTQDVGDFIIQEGVLVEVLGSYEYNESVAPNVIQVRLTGGDVEGKLQFEHVNAVSILEGYRRTLLYRFPAQAGADISVEMLHEFENLDPSFMPFVTKEMEGIESTRDCSFQLRSFELLGDAGFGEESRASRS